MQVQVVHPDIERGRIKSVLFDFDGTLSLIREGWQQIMIPMMVEVLLDTPRHEGKDKIESVVACYVASMTGIQTIYQMLRLVEEVKARGGRPVEAVEYKRMYLARLWERIKDRIVELEEHGADPDDYMVAGAQTMLAGLQSRGVELYLASGTDHPDVVREARALRLDQFFEDRIYGATDRYWEFTKPDLVRKIIAHHQLTGSEFAAFGDGFVEIESAKAVGGIAIGVACDEARREGFDEWKRRRLIQAGADIIIPDFREHAQFISYLWNEASLA